MSAKQVNVSEGLFKETRDGPRLTGSRCSGCSIPYFPASDVCRNPECEGGSVEQAEFGPTGTVWSYARQDYEPPSPVKFDTPFEPYSMAIVDLDDGLRVLGRLLVDDSSTVEVGMKVELVLAPLAHDEEGRQLICWQFRPAERA